MSLSEKINRKNKKTALLLCIFLGWSGAHRFYLRKAWTGLLYFFTFGLFLFGWLFDIFKIAAVKVGPALASEDKGLPALESWNVWDASVHQFPGQSDRILRALEQDIRITKKRPDGRWAVLGSTGIPYVTSFGGCTCEDFARRNIPCKHMYALAIKKAGFNPGLFLPEEV